MDKIKPLKITQAVILAGGAGTRLKPFTLNNPKPMVPVNRKPFLEYLINLLKKNGIKEIIILTGYFGEKINSYFGDGKNFGIKIKYSYTPFRDFFGMELKSGIRILNAHELLNDNFLLLYCDNYLPFNLKKLAKVYRDRKVDLLITAYSNADKSTRNNVLISKKGFLEKYDSSRKGDDLNGVDIGYMIVNKKVLKLLPPGNSKFEEVIFPKLIAKKRAAGFLTDQKYFSIGDPSRVEITANFLINK